ncbi:MAG: metalloregulator ArsR/SmtB family transcription factor [Chloroflexi bacterium]|nr:metalloregulator ArsR/SmtB family transcription factor [Chloroflexota bacterium]
MTTNHRKFKDRLYAEFAVIGKALSSSHRLEMLDLLAQGERSVEDLAAEAALTIANASAHLQVLRRARLVEADKRGLNVVYRLAAPEVYDLWRTLRDVGSTRLAEVQRLVESAPVDKEELLRLISSDAVTVLDVRPTLEYEQGHILAARSIPVQELEDRLAELPQERAIVAYCRGPYCVFADEAVEILRRRGFQARRMEDGLPEWRAAGLPVETGLEGRAG